MANDQDNGSDADDGTVLSPDELDIRDEDSVVEIEEGRYVISPGSREPKVPSDSSVTTERSDSNEAADEREGDLNEVNVHDWIEARLRRADSKYAFDATACFEGHTSQKTLFSNDVVTTFENLVVWYASHAGGDTPVEDVLGILLVEANLSVRFPAESIKRYVDSVGLEEADSIEDLLAAVRESGGIRFVGGKD